jgi:hypothetical protein
MSFPTFLFSAQTFEIVPGCGLYVQLGKIVLKVKSAYQTYFVAMCSN